MHSLVLIRALEVQNRQVKSGKISDGVVELKGVLSLKEMSSGARGIGSAKESGLIGRGVREGRAIAVRDATCEKGVKSKKNKY